MAMGDILTGRSSVNSPLNQRRTSSTFLGCSRAWRARQLRLPRPAGVAAGVEQHQVRQAGGVAQRVLQRHVPAKRVAEHRPPLKAQLLPQRFGTL